VPDSDSAKAIAQTTASLAARMLFRHAAPKLKLVSRDAP
jgi:hypothetical protein